MIINIIAMKISFRMILLGIIFFCVCGNKHFTYEYVEIIQEQ